MAKFIEMKQSDIEPLRRKIWEENDKCCPVLGTPVDFNKTHLDHIHKANNEPYAANKGTIRTTLDGNVNMFFGKLENAFLMNGLHKKTTLIEILKKGIEYLEANPYQDSNGNYYIHPSEVTKRSKVKISEYKRVAKYYLELHPRKRTVIKKPVYVTDEWETLVQLTNEHIQKLKDAKEERKKVRDANKL